MTQEEILAMRPGSELNIKVAEEIMGHTVTQDKVFGSMERTIYSKPKEPGYGWCSPKEGDSIWGPLQSYSEDISVAKLVIDRMIEMGHKDAIHWNDFGGGKYTEAEAICKSALLAVLDGHGSPV
jgi:hypothetical protein